MIENKTKQTSEMEKEKQQLIAKFENTFKRKKQIDAEIVKELFPEDEELYNKIKNMTNKMYKTTYNLNKNNKSNKENNTKEKNEPKTEIKNN